MGQEKGGKEEKEEEGGSGDGPEARHSAQSVETMYNVYKINKHNPDSLFTILTHLKRTYERSSEADFDSPTFSSLEDLKDFVVQECGEKAKEFRALPETHSLEVLNDALGQMQARFASF